MTAALVETLVDRLYDAGAKHRLVDLLRDTKKAPDVPRTSFRVTGNLADVKGAAVQAFTQGHLGLGDLRDLVDSVEETGAQHVFLFRLTAAGKRALTRRRLAESLQALPAQPTTALYSAEPATRRTFFIDRERALTIKSVYCAEYWRLDESESEETEDRIVKVWSKIRKRAVDLACINPDDDTAEVRIGRLQGGEEEKHATTALEQFVQHSGGLDLVGHLEPVPFWESFADMVAARADTYMNIDEGRDPSVIVKISNWREKVIGADVRDHPSYVLDQQVYRRRILSIYWRMPRNPGEDERLVHTLLSVCHIDGRDFGKVYVAARVAPADLAHVLNRIRSFAP